MNRVNQNLATNFESPIIKKENIMTDYMKKFNEDPAVAAYKQFMSEPSNIRNCDSCPENMGCNSLPCGQQNCWVSLHCGDYYEGYLML